MDQDTETTRKLLSIFKVSTRKSLKNKINRRSVLIMRLLEGINTSYEIARNKHFLWNDGH